MADRQFIRKELPTLIRALVDRLNREKLVDDDNAEISLQLEQKGMNVPLYRGRPNGLVSNQLASNPDTVTGLVRDALTRLVKDFGSVETGAPGQRGYLNIFANGQQVASVTADGRIYRTPSQLREQPQLPRSAERSGGEPSTPRRNVAQLIADAYEQDRRKNPVTSFMGTLLREMGDAQTRGAQRAEDTRVARTAVALINREGTLRNGRWIYEAAGYTVERQGNRYSVNDREGRTLLRFRQQLLGPQILENRLTDTVRGDFLQAESFLRNRFSRGYRDYLTADAAERLDQLGALAARDQKGMAEQIALIKQQRQSLVNVPWVVSTARRLLQEVPERYDGRRVSDNGFYLVEQDGLNLKIWDKRESRLVIDLREEGLEAVDLTDLDLRNWAALRDFLERTPPLQSFEVPPPETPLVAVGGESPQALSAESPRANLPAQEAGPALQSGEEPTQEPEPAVARQENSDLSPAPGTDMSGSEPVQSAQGLSEAARAIYDAARFLLSERGSRDVFQGETIWSFISEDSRYAVRFYEDSRALDVTELGSAGPQSNRNVLYYFVDEGRLVEEVRPEDVEAFQRYSNLVREERSRTQAGSTTRESQANGYAAMEGFTAEAASQANSGRTGVDLPRLQQLYQTGLKLLEVYGGQDPSNPAALKAENDRYTLVRDFEADTFALLERPSEQSSGRVVLAAQLSTGWLIEQSASDSDYDYFQQLQVGLTQEPVRREEELIR